MDFGADLLAAANGGKGEGALVIDSPGDLEKLEMEEMGVGDLESLESESIDIDPEEALERTNLKFIKRFQYLEAESKKDGKSIGEMSLEEMDHYWEKAKSLK